MSKRRLRKQKRFDKKTRVLRERPYKPLTLVVTEKDSGEEVLRTTSLFTVSLITDDTLEARGSVLQRALGGGYAVRERTYKSLLTVAAIRLHKDVVSIAAGRVFSTYVATMLKRDDYKLVPKAGWSRMVEVRGYVYTFTVGR